MLSYVVLCTVAVEEAVAFADVYVYREDFDVYAAKLHNSSGISCRFPEKSSRKRTVELHFCDFSQPTICIFYLFSLFHGSFSTYNLYLCAVKQETYGEISQLKKKESYEGLERKESGCIAQWRRRQLRGCGAAGGARREAGPQRDLRPGDCGILRNLAASSRRSGAGVPIGLLFTNCYIEIK